MQLHTPVLTMVRELDTFGLMMSSALAMNPNLLTVLPMQLVYMGVATLRMPVLAVRFSVSEELL